MRTLFQGFLVLAATCMVACQHSGVQLGETNSSLAEIKRAAVEVIGEPRGVSENGFELKSKYYDKKGEPIEKMEDAKDRYYTHVMIVGDRRPYDVSVQVIVEVRTPEGFEQVDDDEFKAEEVADKIKKALHESREKRNVIDDFQAF